MKRVDAEKLKESQSSLKNSSLNHRFRWTTPMRFRFGRGFALSSVYRRSGELGDTGALRCRADAKGDA